MNRSYEILRHDLEAAGVRSGDVLVVHSSLKSMGMVQGGAESVLIDSVALKEKALKKMKEDPLCFVDDPSGFYANGCHSNL